MVSRIILGISTLICFFVFFRYDRFEMTRKDRVMMVEAKASSLQNGRLVGAFIIYREVLDSIPGGEPLTVLVDGHQYEKAQIGDVNVEVVRNQFAYILFILGVVTLFLFFLSLNIDISDLFDVI